MNRVQNIPIPKDARVRRAVFGVGDALANLGREVASLEADLRQAIANEMPVEPTWTSAMGKTYRLRDMPTRYLRNIEAKAQRMAGSVYEEPEGAASGLVRAIRLELQRRED